MKKLHEKSRCCGGSVRLFGGRRRQCAKCGKTWRAWKKRRGRKKKRTGQTLVIRYLDHALSSSYGRARHLKTIPDTMERSLLRSRDLFIRTTPWPTLPKGPSILVADAKIVSLKGEQHAVYLILVRPVRGTRAVVAPPVIWPDRENHAGWKAAFDSLPEDVKNRIKAIICDGHKGILDYAKRHGILIQRCHFHLLAALQGRRSKWRKSRHREEGKRIYELVSEVLLTEDEKRAAELLLVLDEAALQTDSPGLRRYLLGFINAYEYFRNYRHHPELHLPRTTNAAESYISAFQELLHRARGFRSMKSLTLWLETFVKYKRDVTCNGFQPKNCG